MNYKKTQLDSLFEPMGIIVVICLIIVLGGHFLLGHEGPPDPQITVAGKIIKVVDGDTVDVEVKTIIRVRLIDCWAPESKIDNRVAKEKQKDVKDLGLKSKQNLTDLSLNKNVLVSVPISEKNDLTKSLTLGRILGRVWIDGDSKSLSEHQVESGNATPSKQF